MRKEQQIQRVSRIIDVNSHKLTIEEHTELENEAGAVVWDAALVLLNYFCTGRQQLSDLACGLTSQSSQLLLRSVLSDYSYLRFTDSALQIQVFFKASAALSWEQAPELWA